MTTGADLVTRAFQASGIYGSGEAISADDSALALSVCNSMLDSWSNERGMIYDVYIDSFTMTPGQASYSSSLLSNGRPIAVDSIYIRQSNVDYPIELIDNQTYGEISYKPTGGLPDKCYVDTGYPDITFFFFPVPSTPYTAFISGWKKLQDTITLTTTLAMPLGYEKAIIDNLSLELCPYFDRNPSPLLVKSAARARKVLKLTNYVPLEMETNTPIGQGLFNIYRGS